MPSPVRRRRSASQSNNSNQSSKEKQQPSGETSCERAATTTVAITKTTIKTETVMDGNEGKSHQQQLPSSSLQSRTRTSISPRTRGNSIARILASPGDLLHDTNLNNTTGSGGGGNSAARRELPRRNIIQNKFISPDKRSTAEATLNLLARRRSTRNSLEETGNVEVVRRPKQTHAAAAATDTSSLTTPGGRRRKRKAACDAQSKVRDICELEDFDQLDELLLDSSQKVPYNEPSSLTMNQGRKKRTMMGRSVGVGAGAAVSDIVVVADRRSPAASPSSSGMKNGPSTPRIVAGTANNNTVDTKVASFVPMGKVEERWFRNFNKWRCNSSSSTSSTTATTSPKKNASPLVTTSTMPLPTSPPPKLWIREQRVQYNLWKQDKKSQLTKQRIDLLESAGFCWEMNERKKAKAAAASATTKKNVTTSKSNPRDTDGSSKGRITSKDASETTGTNHNRRSEKRKSPRESLTTQFYHNLEENTSESSKNNQPQVLLRDSTESVTTTVKTSLKKRRFLPNPHSSAVTSSHPTITTDDHNIKVEATSDPISPKIRSKNGRRGRHSMDSMASLMTLDISTETRSVPGAGKKKVGAATLRAESLSYKELEMAVNKSLQQKARKKSSATKLSSSTDSKLEKKSSDRKVDGSDKTETSEEVDVPLINCNDLSPSLKSPLLVMTRLPTSSSASKDPQSHPAAVAAKSTEPVCVRELMLSCLSEESPPAESGDISIRPDDEHPNPSTNGSNITTDGRNSSATSMNSTVGSHTVSFEPGGDAFVKSRSVGDALQPNLDSPQPEARLEPTLPNNSTNMHHTPTQPNNAGDSPSYTSCDAAHVNSPWEHDTDFVSTIEATDIDLLSNSPDPSNAANKPRRLFSPTYNLPSQIDPQKNANKDESSIHTQSQTRIRPANRTSQKEIGTGTADPSSQISETQSNLPVNTEDANNDESSMQLYFPLSLTSPHVDVEPSQTRIQHGSVANTNTEDSNTQNSLVTSNVGSHFNGNLGAHVPVALQAVEPNHSMVEYRKKWTNFGLIEMEMKLVAHRMRELEEKMKLVDSSAIPIQNGIDGERGGSASKQAVAYRPNSRSRSTSKSHHSSSDYYESSEEEYNDEYCTRSPMKQQRRSGYRGSKEIVGNRSSRRVDTHRATVQRGRSRSNHDDRRNGRPSKKRFKNDERYYSDRSDSSEDFADYADDRHQTQGRKQRSGRKKGAELNASSGSKESRTNQKPKRRHPVSVLETASPSKPAVADDHLKDEKSAHSEQSSASKTSVVKTKISQNVDAKPSEVQRNDSTAADDRKSPSNDNGNESTANYTSCVFGDRLRAPLFWLARGESSSDDESWDFDGPMILPPSPL